MKRYTRQSRLFEVGPAGQARLAEARYHVPGTGLTAETCALYLAGSGAAVVHVDVPAIADEIRALRGDMQHDGITHCVVVDEANAAAQLPLACSASQQYLRGSLLALAALKQSLGA
jgi:hypothetical protein